MYTDLNLFDEVVLNGIISNCEFNKDMTIDEVIDTINSNDFYKGKVTYSSNTMILHIEGMDGYKVNISIKSKKIFIVVKNNKEDVTSVSHLLYYNNKSLGEIHAILLTNFCSKYQGIDINKLWALIDKNSDIESIDYIMSTLVFNIKTEDI